MIGAVRDPNTWKLALALAAPLCFYFAFRNWRLARLLDDTPRSRIRSAAQGYVELGGRARLPPDTVNNSPLTDRPCAWWLYRIERNTMSNRNRWETIDRNTSAQIFVIEDETGCCLVNPQGADVRPTETTVWYGADAWPTGGFAAGRTDLFGSRNYRYTEHRIVETEHVNVIGDFRTVGGVATEDIDGEVMQLLAQWKQDQPALLQRFDTNHDGVLSQGEWEVARAAARRQIEQQPPRAAAPNLNVMMHPQDKRPYLIAACDLRTLAWRTRLGSAGLIAAFLVAVVALARLLLGPA